MAAAGAAAAPSGFAAAAATGAGAGPFSATGAAAAKGNDWKGGSDTWSRHLPAPWKTSVYYRFRCTDKTAQYAAEYQPEYVCIHAGNAFM